jgi:hypothetical protein
MQGDNLTLEDSDKKHDTDRINSMLKGYKRASDHIRDPRNKLFDEWEEFQRGNHWGKNQVAGDYPSIPLTWYIWDSQVAKVCDRPVKLAVVPQEACEFPLYMKDEVTGETLVDELGEPIPDMDHPFRQAVEENRANLPEEISDNEIHAQFLNALLQREWEVGRLPSKLYQSASMAAWFSECWPIVGRDDFLLFKGESPIFVDLIHPKRAIKDPDATGPHDMRFFGYETPRTRGYIRQRWGDEVAENLKPGTLENEKFEEGIAPDDDRAEVMLECWFVRDDSLDKHPVDPTVEIDEKDDTTFYELPKYTRGWFKVLRCQDKILEGPTDAGRFPASWFPWWPMPGKLEANGIMDLFRTMNFTVDQSMFYALENARTTGQNTFFYDEAAFAGKEDLLSNLPGKLVPAPAANGNVQNAIVAVQGLDVSQSHYQNINLNRELMEAMSGSQDLKVNQNLPRDASGEFMKELKAGIASRLAIVRDEQLLRVAKEIARVMLDLLLDDDEPVTVRLPGSGEPKYITIVPSALKFDDQDFEAKFDIVADGSTAEPHNPIERDQYYDNIIRQLMAMPPPLAELRINLADWSRKDEIRAKLAEYWKFQQAQAEAAAQQPNEAMIKAQAAAAGQVAKDFSQGIQDLAAGIRETDPVLALDTLMAAIPVAMAIAQGQQPDLGDFALIRQKFESKMAALPMVSQPADLVPNSDPQTLPM